MTNTLLWTQSTKNQYECYHADGREGRHYMVMCLDHLEGFEYGVDLPWLASAILVNSENYYRNAREPRQEHSMLSAQRLCQAWEDSYELADEFLISGDIELAQRLRSADD